MPDRPDLPASPRPGTFRDALRRCGAAAGRAMVRLPLKLYALALILVIGWLSWRAFRYLAVSLLFTAPPPTQVTGLPRELGEETLLGGRSAFAALGAVEHPRSPLAHYHRSEGWVAADRLNDCTRGGCHSPLPHAERKEVRAFLNMHATSIHCGVCHMTPEAGAAQGSRAAGDSAPRSALQAAWYDRQTGRPSDPPALLRLYELLVSAAQRAPEFPPTRDLQERIVFLLREASKEGRGLPALERLADHFAAVRPQSEVFGELLQSARETLPGYFRGDYGAKLALLGEDGAPLLGHPGTEDAVQAWLNADRNALGEERRDRMIEAIHPRKRAEALHCTDCHRAGEGLINFAVLGYPPARMRSLRDPFLFQMIEHISAGRDMYLPTFISPTRPNPTTQPATQPAP